MPLLKHTEHEIAGLILILLILTSLGSVSAETPILNVSGNDRAPKIIFLGEDHNQNNILMLQISFNTTFSDGITIGSIILHRSGQSSDSAVELISLYEDNEDKMELSLDNDTLLSSSEFTLGKAELSVGKTVRPESPLDLLAVIDISSEAQSGGTLGIDIPNTDYIVLENQGIVEFVLPIASKNSSIELDSDGDLNPDSTDPDDDNDGYMDDNEIAAGSDPKDENSLPKDTDSDLVPDVTDTDDDNDGVPDRFDDFPTDKNKTRDYTMVMIYLIIAIILIVALLLVMRSKKTKIRGNEPKEVHDDEGEFELHSHEMHHDPEETVLDEEDDELLDEA